MPELRKATVKLFSKDIVSKGYGFHTPQDGSVCKIRIITDENNVMAESDSSNEKEIVVGDVDEPIDRILEDCIRTMKEEEECLLKFVHPCLNNIFVPEDSQNETQANVVETVETEGGKESSSNDNPPESAQNEISKKDSTETSVSQTENEENTADIDSTPKNEELSPKENISEKIICTNMVEVQFQLLSYTREPEIWEMSVTEKWRRASYHKQRGLELYSRGAYQYAFRRFGLTLKYVISLEHDIPSGQEEGMDIKGLKLSCYLNVAACQMRHHNFDSVVINSAKALNIHPNNAKALYRRGSAYVQLQEYEKAKEDLDMAQQLEPKNQAIAKQQQLLKNQVQKLNQYYASAMKKLFS